MGFPEGGAGIFINSTTPVTITNCTIVDNNGSGIDFLDYASVPLIIRNTILWNNGDDLVDPTDTTVSYSNIEDGDFLGVNGNISQDPQFVDSVAGNYRLQEDSVCVDAGGSDEAPLTDILGRARYDDPLVTNTGAGDDPYYDMGAYEYVIDSDGDEITDDGDGSGVEGDNPCTGGNVLDCDDNCPDVANPLQEDCDFDGTGDACEVDLVDPDGDLIDSACDNCPDHNNPDQADADGDGLGYPCDAFPTDFDNDGIEKDGAGDGETYTPCVGGNTVGCDDNCADVAEPGPGRY